MKFAFALLLLCSPLFADAPQALSPAAEADPVIEDDAEPLSPTPQLDLNLAETRLLAKIAEGAQPEMADLYFNVEENAPAELAGPGVSRVEVAALYAELAKRTVAEDREARSALQAAALRDKRAVEAKDEAYAQRLALSYIKRLENGDKGAKDELLKLALKGNAKARLYLGLDKPAAAAEIPEAITPTAAVPATAAADAAAVSPSAKP